MHCLITAGPTYEAMDEVRRLTNFSTGQLGTELARFLATRGHTVTLLLGEQATYHGESGAQRTERFSTTENLREMIRALASPEVGAVFHAAAVSDYRFGRIWRRLPEGELIELRAGKISTRQGVLMAELVPTPKIIGELRELFPGAKLVGWKFEVDGDRSSAVAVAEQQLHECRTDACVANGRAYGSGFGIVTGPGRCDHQPDQNALFMALERFVSAR